ncbi:uncharacterized protein LOC141712816 [Apium graveolens]|uniref:uncharacterized protein LOC141712816 n=1 Tax=Apium graveolens TaxID=4045 RepID=UPI003D7A2BDF
MVEFTILNARFTYIHHYTTSVDTHHVVVRPNASLNFILLVSRFLLLAIPFLLLLLKNESATLILWILLVVSLLFKLWLWKPVDKESIIIMPNFGVQLETQYRCGSNSRRFIPMSKILKPVLNECVTPVTCYWSLSLIVRGEEELTLVFKELQPPIKMLVPIWKALCAAADCR